ECEAAVERRHEARRGPRAAGEPGCNAEPERRHAVVPRRDLERYRLARGERRWNHDAMLADPAVAEVVDRDAVDRERELAVVAVDGERRRLAGVAGRDRTRGSQPVRRIAERQRGAERARQRDLDRRLAIDLECPAANRLAVGAPDERERDE